jgi:endonuclease/exonuclease/phosphatase family metal-dependent hydrolase
MAVIPEWVPVTPSAAITRFKVLTVNTHKGFTALNRRFILPELREAVRGVAADVVFLQEVHGTHEHHPRRYSNWPSMPQYEFLADSIWPQFAYGRNAVYPHGDHGNALLSKFQIIRYDNLDISQSGHESRGLLHCVLRLPGTGREVHAICVHLGLREVHRQQQLKLLAQRIAEIPGEAPLIVAGDFNDWRQQADLSHSGLQEVFRASPRQTGPYVSGAPATAGTGPHLCAQPQGPSAASADNSPLVAPVGSRAAVGGD